jgi:cytochrome c553
MVKSTDGSNKIQKKMRGRQPTARGTVNGIQIAVRLSPDEIARLDAWIERQREQFGIELSRPAALRACLNMALK